MPQLKPMGTGALVAGGSTRHVAGAGPLRKPARGRGRLPWRSRGPASAWSQRGRAVDGRREAGQALPVTDGKGFRLADHDPADTGGLDLDKKEARGLLQEGIERLAELQAKLYAQDRWAVLLIFQAMDAAGKDSAIKHVMSGVNPQGVQVYAFKQPSAEE